MSSRCSPPLIHSMWSLGDDATAYGLPIMASYQAMFSRAGENSQNCVAHTEIEDRGFLSRLPFEEARVRVPFRSAPPPVQAASGSIVLRRSMGARDQHRTIERRRYSQPAGSARPDSPDAMTLFDPLNTIPDGTPRPIDRKHPGPPHTGRSRRCRRMAGITGCSFPTCLTTDSRSPRR
jgi:hypothetical protein